MNRESPERPVQPFFGFSGCGNRRFFSWQRLKAVSALLSFLSLQTHSAIAVGLGDRVKVTSTIGVNVRMSAGGTPYATGQPFGSLGVATSGPQFAQVGGTMFEWWLVDFDSGQDGWVAVTNVPAVIPDPPTLIYPGDGLTVREIQTLTPTFRWDAVRGATNYGLYLQQADTFPIDNDTIGNVTSYPVPAGVLQPDKYYAWNMRASDSAGYSAYSSGTSGRLYFRTAVESVTAPGNITGELNAIQETSYSYTVGASTCVYGHPVEYSFSWGDGSPSSSYSTSTSASHSWSSTGQKFIIVTARCRTNPSITADNSAANYYVIVRPINDDFARRILISAPTLAVTGNSANATKEPGEPNHAGSAGGRSVWWSWTSSTAGSATIGTAGSSFDTLLAVYTGSSVSVLSPVASNDDDTAHGVSTSLVTFNAAAGTTYQIAVDGLAGLSGSIQLAITPPSPVGPAPVAKIVGDRRPVPGKPVSYDGTLSTGTEPLSFAWVTTDGQSSIDKKPQFAFNSPGEVSVTLTVSDSIGRANTKSLPVIVQASNNGTGPGQTIGADPVVLSSGNYIAEHVDLRLPGKGFPFEFKRFYNSKFSDQSGVPLGFGWTHPYNERLKDTGTNVLIVRGNGSTWTFFTNDSGYIGEKGLFSSLVHNLDNTWSLVDKAQTVRLFDVDGKLLSMTDKNSNVLSLHYEGPTLTQIIDTAGRTILLNTNTDGLISEIADPIGRHVRFEYEQTNLVRVIDANGQTNRYEYNQFHQIVNAFDARGTLYLHNDYDPTNVTVFRQHDAFGNWTYFTYDFDNRFTYQTNAMGKVSVHKFDHRLLVTNIVDEAGNELAFEYDDDRNRTLVRDKNGNVTHYTYDELGNVTNKTDAAGDVTVIEYDTRNNPTRRLDALTNATTFGYDERGNLTSTTNALGHVNRVAYDSSGLPTILTDARGFSTTNQYDLQGNPVAIVDAHGFTNRADFDAVGRKFRQVDANGGITLFLFDNNDNLLVTTNALGFTNAYLYDANNNRIVSLDPRAVGVTNVFDLKDRLVAVSGALNSFGSNRFDALDRKIESFDARLNPTGLSYDDVGNLIATTNALSEVTRLTPDANGNTIAATDPANHSSTKVYDALNRLIFSVNALNYTNTTAYDAVGHVAATTNANGQVTRFRYDAIGRLTNVLDSANQPVSFAYDENGNRIRTIDPNGHTWTNVFDELNRVVERHDPTGAIFTFSYDPVGNLTNKVTPNGDNIGYRYDALNRLTHIIYPTGPSTTFAYDAVGNRTNMTDGLGTTVWEYDSLNRLTSVTDPFGETVQYGYDEKGNRVSLTYPGGRTLNYRFDPLNRMIALTNWLGGVVTYAYDNRGNMIAATNVNGTTVLHGYDEANRLITLTNARSNGDVIAGYVLTLDGIGNHLQSAHEQPLFPIFSNQTNSYIYDADNRLISLDGRTVAHDSNGNLTSIGTNTTFSYDFDDQLIHFSMTNLSGSCTYDGLGNRLSRTVGGETTRLVLDRSGALTQVLVQTGTNGSPTAYYVYGLGLAHRITTDGTLTTYHFDVRGSTVALTDETGTVTDGYAFDSFGVLANREGDSPQPFRYLGRYGIMDDSTGLYHARARYFSPQLGRFLTKDAFTGQNSDGQSLNRYVYALNNPVARMDIDGNLSVSTLGTAAGQSGMTLVYFVLGVSDAIGAGVTFVATENPLALPSGFASSIETLNNAFRSTDAAAQNVVRSFRNQLPVQTSQGAGPFDNVLSQPEVQRLLEINHAYSLFSNVRDLGEAPRRIQDSYTALVTYRDLLAQDTRLLAALQSFEEFKSLYESSVQFRDYILRLATGDVSQRGQNTPSIREITETQHAEIINGKK
jgi:RHS repeat-associated protein